MRCITYPALVSANTDKLSVAETTQEKIDQTFPRHLCSDIHLTFGQTGYVLARIFQFLLQALIRLVLRPRHGHVGSLNVAEVDAVYDREAATYDCKHHLTTRGMDTTWRRLAGYTAVNVGRRNGTVNALDLCTGTGLTVKEMASMLVDWGIQTSIIGLDYNERMLALAKRRQIDRQNISTRFVRGDAMNLANDPAPHSGLECFQANTFNVVTQMFGIGGISQPVKVFSGVLQVLKPAGQYFLIDMHQPIVSQPGEWPLGLKWLRWPELEMVTYKQTTIPLALNRLWGWRDTTLDFYLLPLTTWQDTNGQYWGFETISFETESQRWWFGLPIMPTGKITVEKTEISRAEHQRRQKLLSMVINQ